MLKRLKNTRFSILQKLRNKIAPSQNVVKTLVAPTDIYDSTQPNTNLYMDDVAQEYIAQITSSTYEQQNQTNPDFPTAPNFGTVDNPLQIFTTDYPFRFVACTGHPNEDDYEGHEPMWFILREGPLQRCAQCGQVFKLIKLRQDEEERKPGLLQLGDQDHPGVTSLRTFFQLQKTPSLISQPVNNFYSTINPDDHDQFLVDPKYRMEKNMDGERVMQQTMENFKKLTQSYQEQYGVRKKPMSRQIYENLVDAEMAVKNLDKHFSNILKFNYRRILDPENHERREQRMLEKKQQKLNNAKELGFIVDEDKEGYLDYFETDLENETSQKIFDEFNDKKQEIMSDTRMKIQNIEFQELYNDQNQPDSEGVINRKIFRFKYREALYSLEEHQRKEQRMIDRNQNLQHLQELQQLVLTQNKDRTRNQFSKKSQDIKNIEESNKQNIEIEYYNSLIQQSLKCYRDYFESDLEDDFNIVEEMPFESQIKTTEMLGNTHINYALRIQQDQIKMGEDYGLTQIDDIIQETFGKDVLGQYDNKMDQMNFQDLFQKYKPLDICSINDSVNKIEQIIQSDVQNRWESEKQNLQELKQSIEDLANKQNNKDKVDSQVEQLENTYQNFKSRVKNIAQNYIHLEDDISVKNMLQHTKEKVDENLQQTNEKLKEVLKEGKEKTKETISKVQDKFEDGKEKMKETISKVQEKVEEGKEKTKETMSNVKDKAEVGKEKLKETMSKVQDKAEVGKEKMKEAMSNVQDKAEQIKEETKEKMQQTKQKVEVGTQTAKQKLNKVQHKAEEIKEQTKEKLKQAKEKVEKKMKEGDERVEEKGNVGKERTDQIKNTKETIDTNQREDKNKKK